MEPARLPTRERQRRDTRMLILDAALAEIAERGLAAARIGRIAAEAGVTRPTIYAHFPQKQDFLRELQARTEARALAALRDRLGEDDAIDEIELVHRLADAIFDLVDAADPVLRREVFAYLVREPQGTEWVGNALFAFLTERFATARADDSGADELPAVEFTRIVMTSLFGFLVVETASSDERRRNAHRMLDLLCGGVRR